MAKNEQVNTEPKAIDFENPETKAMYEAFLARAKEDLKSEIKVSAEEATQDRYKRLQENEAKRAAEETEVTLFLDGDKYKDDVYVGYNGKAYLVRRGTPVKVPRAVAEILTNSTNQVQAAAVHNRGLQDQYEDKQKQFG